MKQLMNSGSPNIRHHHIKLSPWWHSPFKGGLKILS